MEKFVVKAVPSSFVYRKMKIVSETGSGEGKLFIGAVKKTSEFDSFFEFETDYKYKLDKQNLLDYMHEVKVEYVYQFFNRYQEANIQNWDEYFEKIKTLTDAELFLNLVKQTDDTRYYVDQEKFNDADKLIFKNFIRKIIVPKLTNIEFEKDTDKKIITLKLFVNYDFSRQMNSNENEQPSSSSVIPYSNNRIIFGAPGTGKSFQLNKNLKDESGANYFTYYERVTFHPSYSYANFVGTYKPVKDEKSDGQITYEFVEGPFIRVLRQALCDNDGNNYLLVIEEINRANVAAVFGDVFQLLDRDSNNFSQYQVAASEDLRKHLIKHGVPEDSAIELKIPSNMYIWATMNSADQGVQPLDTAFKRRWEFEYLSINNSEEKIDANMKNIQFPDQTMDWNLLRHLINNRISSNYIINEDKLLGPFFIKKGNQTDEQFIKSFKSKVLMYLFEDVCKINPKPLFVEIEKVKLYFSDIVSAFDEKGLGIFKFSEEEIKKAKLEMPNGEPKSDD